MVTYEWDIETSENDEIVDHHHADKLKDLPELGENDSLVLVRTEERLFGDRLWAYVVNDELPLFFSDSAGDITTCAIPKKFRQEFEKSKFSRKN